MIGFRFFSKVPKHQQFEYKPRYWDPRKEELQERLKYLDSLQDEGVDGMKARISGGLRRGGGYFTDRRMRQRQIARSNMVLVAVIIALLVLCYLMLVVYLPQIEQMFK